MYTKSNISTHSPWVLVTRFRGLQALWSW